MLVCQEHKKFQGGDADDDDDDDGDYADADGSTDRHEGWNSYVDEDKSGQYVCIKWISEYVIPIFQWLSLFYLCFEPYLLITTLYLL